MSATPPPDPPGQHSPPGHDPNPERDEHGKPVKGAVGKTESKLGKHGPLITVTLSVLSLGIAYLAWKSKSAGQAAKDAAAAASTLVPTSGLPSTSGQVAGGSDGSGSTYPGDPSAGLQAMFQNLSDEIQQLSTAIGTGGLTGTTPPPFDPGAGGTPLPVDPLPGGGAPKPKPPYVPHLIYGPAAKGLRYIRDVAKGIVYQIQPDGSRYQLKAGDWAELGRPWSTTIDYDVPAKPKVVAKPKAKPKGPVKPPVKAR